MPYRPPKRFVNDVSADELEFQLIHVLWLDLGEIAICSAHVQHPDAPDLGPVWSVIEAEDVPAGER